MANFIVDPVIALSKKDTYLPFFCREGGIDVLNRNIVLRRRFRVYSRVQVS